MDLTSMRILHTESSMGLGGQEFRILHEAVGMQKRGHQVFLAAPPESQLTVEAQRRGMPIIPLTMSTGRWVFLVFRFMKIYEKFRIEVVNTHGSIDSWTASLAGRLSPRAPVIIRTRHKSTPVSNTFRHRLLYAKLPNRVLTTGESVRQELIENIGVEPAKIVSIPTGVDLDKFSPREPDFLLKRSLEIGGDQQIVGTIAFLRDYKGVNIFLQAAAMVIAKNPLVTFLVIGDGPEKHNLENLAHELSLDGHVRFLGFRDDIPGLLSILDVVVLSSLNSEGVPQALTQALAMERAVVATSVGGIPEIIREEETGLLVPPGDAGRMAFALLRLLNERELRSRLGKTGYCYVNQSLSLAKMLDKTEALYREAVSK